MAATAKKSLNGFLAVYFDFLKGGGLKDLGGRGSLESFWEVSEIFGGFQICFSPLFPLSPITGQIIPFKQHSTHPSSPLPPSNTTSNLSPPPPFLPSNTTSNLFPPPFLPSNTTAKSATTRAGGCVVRVCAMSAPTAPLASVTQTPSSVQTLTLRAGSEEALGETLGVWWLFGRVE